MTEIVINGNTSYFDKLLEVDQINDFTLNELRLLRNTIFAKYGYMFTSDDLIHHFSQFSWYEGNKINVQNELTSIDWNNIRLIQILESYYPIKVDYVFGFQQNGIYKLDKSFILTPIFTYNDDNGNWHGSGSYGGYIQLDDFLFFSKTQFEEKILFYDYRTNYWFDMGDQLHYPYIVSIFYQSKNTLVVNGFGRYIGSSRNREPVSVTINFPDDRFDDSIIGTTNYFPEGLIGRKDIYFGFTYIMSNDIVNYFIDEYGGRESVREHLFTAFGKNIIIILENTYLWIYQGQINRSDPELLGINVIYNDIYNVYFLTTENFGFLTR